MTDERIDALIRRLDVPSDPDPDVAQSIYLALRARARAARVTDASPIGRLRRDLRSILAGGRWPSLVRPVGVRGLLVLLLLATLVALAIIGALSRVQPIPNGPLVVAIYGELKAVDTDDGFVRPILPPGELVRGVSRSPDGRLVAFWSTGNESELSVVGVDGQARRELASDLGLGWTDSIDTWSSDSRFLATEVLLDGITRIVVADVTSGAARVVTPPGVIAHSPLWSPDDRWIAFTQEMGAISSLAIIRVDGSGMRTVSGNVVGVGGPDTWSPDGAWIYFDSDFRIYRANVGGGFSQQLTGDDLQAVAPASSPDGTRIAFMRPGCLHTCRAIYVAQSDGKDARLLLEHASQLGWSADSRYILAQWTPSDQPGGLALVKPDGSEVRIVLPFDADCSTDPRHECLDGVGWGQPRP
jgi:Tol biopolymer transport system component